MTTIKVNVTQECIDKGNRRKAKSCMLHRALESIIAYDFYVTSPDPEHYFEIGIRADKVFYCRLPEWVRRITDEWDSGNNVMPFSFEMDIPDECMPIPVENWPSEVAVERVSK